jgi:DNA-binding response OmpR family regulator
LVVEDQAIIRELLERGLRHHGFDVVLAANGEQAVDLYRALCQEVDLVLLDVQMPGLDGPQTLTALQKINPVVRCCFMSAFAAGYTEEDLRERGMAYIHKPFALFELATLLNRLCGR